MGTSLAQAPRRVAGEREPESLALAERPPQPVLSTLVASSRWPQVRPRSHTFGGHSFVQQAAVLLGRQARRQAADKQADMWGHSPALSHIEPRLAHLPQGCLQGGGGTLSGALGDSTPAPSPPPSSSRKGPSKRSLGMNGKGEEGHKGLGQARSAPLGGGVCGSKPQLPEQVTSGPRQNRQAQGVALPATMDVVSWGRTLGNSIRAR